MRVHPVWVWLQWSPSSVLHVQKGFGQWSGKQKSQRETVPCNTGVHFLLVSRFYQWFHSCSNSLWLDLLNFQQINFSKTHMFHTNFCTVWFFHAGLPFFIASICTNECQGSVASCAPGEGFLFPKTEWVYKKRVQNVYCTSSGFYRVRIFQFSSKWCPQAWFRKHRDYLRFTGIFFLPWIFLLLQSVSSELLELWIGFRLENVFCQIPSETLCLWTRTIHSLLRECGRLLCFRQGAWVILWPPRRYCFRRMTRIGHQIRRLTGREISDEKKMCDFTWINSWKEGSLWPFFGGEGSGGQC